MQILCVESPAQLPVSLPAVTQLSEALKVGARRGQHAGPISTSDVVSRCAAITAIFA